MHTPVANLTMRCHDENMAIDSTSWHRFGREGALAKVNLRVVCETREETQRCRFLARSASRRQRQLGRSRCQVGWVEEEFCRIADSVGGTHVPLFPFLVCLHPVGFHWESLNNRQRHVNRQAYWFEQAKMGPEHVHGTVSLLSSCYRPSLGVRVEHAAGQGQVHCPGKTGENTEQCVSVWSKVLLAWLFLLID